MTQILKQPQDRNHLDLAFVHNTELSFCSLPNEYEIFDKSSRFRSPFIINYHIEDIEEIRTERNPMVEPKINKQTVKTN